MYMNIYDIQLSLMSMI